MFFKRVKQYSVDVQRHNGKVVAVAPTSLFLCLAFNFEARIEVTTGRFTTEETPKATRSTEWLDTQLGTAVEQKIYDGGRNLQKVRWLTAALLLRHHPHLYAIGMALRELAPLVYTIGNEEAIRIFSGIADAMPETIKLEYDVEFEI